jgi:hypothetical protein
MNDLWLGEHMNERWLVCKFFEGMLPGESGVSFETSERKELSMFVSLEKIRRLDNDHGSFRVLLMDENDKDSLVSLPSACIEGPRIVRVAREALTS